LKIATIKLLKIVSNCNSLRYQQKFVLACINVILFVSSIKLAIMEDYRKRNSEFDSTENKRPRSNNDEKKLMTRILISKAEFGKVIGKGGHSVSTIQSKSGATVKGTNVDDDLRLVRLFGSDCLLLS